MKYEPRTYWPARLAREGAKYVGRGSMDAKGVDMQARQFWAHIQPLIPDECESLLDFGCGVGRLATKLVVHCDFYTGVDICKQALLLAPDLPDGSEYIHLEEDHIPFSVGQFDCIVAVTTLQHIVDPDEFSLWCDELNRVAADGCVFVIIDNHQEGDGTAHVRARTRSAVARALGAKMVSSEIISVEKQDSHWLLKAVKKGDS